MRRNGYRVIAKDLTKFVNRAKKANLDIEVAVDMLNLVPYYDTAVLVSGNGDVAYAVNAVSYKLTEPIAVTAFLRLLVATLLMARIMALLTTIESIPLLAPFLQLVGVGFTGSLVYRRLRSRANLQIVQ